MKLHRSLFAIMLAAAFLGGSQAQAQYRHHRMASSYVAPNPQALAALQNDLIHGIEQMKIALPIYDGNRVRAIHQAHEALVIVDEAIAGKNAVVRTKPVVTDTVSSATAHSKYTKDQIASSQATMRRAALVLQQAFQDLQSAAGSNPNKKAIRVSNHLKNATAELTKAIALHAAQG